MINIYTTRLLNSLNGDVKDFLKEVLADGWMIIRSKKHIVLKKDNRIFTIPKSPSDTRSIRNMRSNLCKLQMGV